MESDDDRSLVLMEEAVDPPVDDGAEKAAPKTTRFQLYFMFWPEERVYEEVIAKRNTSDPRKICFPTNIQMPRKLIARLKERGSDGKRAERAWMLENEVMNFATPLGLEIVQTSRLTASAPPNTEGTEGLRLLFSYKKFGRKHTDVLDLDAIPPEVLQVIAEKVRTDKDYQKDEAYRAWYWPFIAVIRERVVSEEIAKRYPDTEDAAKSTEAASDEEK